MRTLLGSGDILPGLHKDCLRVMTGAQVEVRIRFRLGSGLGLMVREAVGMVKVRSWGRHYTYESPHKDR